MGVQMVPVEGSVEAALAALDPNVEAVYILPLLQLSQDDFRRLVEGLNGRGIPTMSWFGEREVNLGAMLGRMPEGFDALIARRTALNMQRALLGDELASMVVDYPTSIRLTLNMATADAIGFSPPYTLLSEATLVDDHAATARRRVTLESAVQEAVTENLDLQVETGLSSPLRRTPSWRVRSFTADRSRPRSSSYRREPRRARVWVQSAGPAVGCRDDSAGDLCGSVVVRRRGGDPHPSVAGA